MYQYMHGRRMRLSDDERRRLAVIGRRLGRRILAEVATIVTPDTILRWHRELIARKGTHVTSRVGRPGVQVEIRRLAVRMANENRSWGYTRIQGALKNLGHRVARSTIAKILKEQGIPPSRERPMAWRTFCAPTGERCSLRISSRPKCGPRAGWSPTTRCL